MVTMDWLLEKYGESHQNPINKLIHWLCVPSIVLSAFGILYAVPFVVERGLFTNWAFVFYVSALIWYLRLSVPIAVGMAVVCGAMILGVDAIYNAVGRDALSLVKVSVGIFAAAWVVQSPTAAA